MPASVEVPKRALFTAGEVCEIAHVQPYVLRSWESEFPALGVAREAGGPRFYRRSDVERVLRIKELLFVHGLTLAGARRRIEEDPAPPVGDGTIEELLGRHARERLTAIRQGLRSILELLSTNGGAGAASELPRRARARMRRAKAAHPVRKRPPQRRSRPRKATRKGGRTR